MVPGQLAGSMRRHSPALSDAGEEAAEPDRAGQALRGTGRQTPHPGSTSGPTAGSAVPWPASRASHGVRTARPWCAVSSPRPRRRSGAAPWPSSPSGRTRTPAQPSAARLLSSSPQQTAEADNVPGPPTAAEPTRNQGLLSCLDGWPEADGVAEGPELADARRIRRRRDGSDPAGTCGVWLAATAEP